MVLLRYLSLAIFNPLLALGYPQDTPTSSIKPQPTFCGDIIRKTKRGPDGEIKQLEASEVFQCLSSVPFNAAVGSRFIKYFNDTLQFHSTLAYLKKPPTGYQQPAVDLIHNLGIIQSKLNQAQFRNQYDFEEAIQQLIYSAHDKHIHLNAGLLSPFRFKSPFRIVSYSLDGKQEPRLYLLDHVKAASGEGVGWKPSPIAKVNGQNVEEYLTGFIQKHSPGNLDPHADWNSIMYSPSQTISGDNELFQNLILYPGDSIQIKLENGTLLDPQSFKATYVSIGPTGPLETGGDFYNFFVLGIYPKKFYDEKIKPFLNAQEDNSTSKPEYQAPKETDLVPQISSTPLSKGWSNIDKAWPSPNLLQADFDESSRSMISGYFVNGTDLAVLSIPTFEAAGFATDSFSLAIDRFIEESINRGKNRLVIDLQQNGGGSSTLAVDTFRRFFPHKEVNDIGSRIRAHDVANELGQLIDEKFRQWDSSQGPSPDNDATALMYEFSTSEWVASNRINPDTNQDFANWAEFFGPIHAADDNFTKIQLYNFSNAAYDTRSYSFPETFHIVYGYPGNRPENRTKSFSATNITILTDGLCDSACSLFVEMMRVDAKVRVVAVGGRPSDGPMQATGTRGARSYSFDELDYDMDIAQYFAKEDLKRPVTSIPERVNDIFAYEATINVRDFIRKGQDIPLQFVYDAADCRIYYTKDTLFNQTALWISAAETLLAPESLCVSHSTTKKPPTPLVPSESPIPTPDMSPDLGKQLLDEILNLTSHTGVRGAIKDSIADTTGKDCTISGGCAHLEGWNMKCVEVPECAAFGQTKKVCVQDCHDDTYCRLNARKLTGVCSKSYCIPNAATICGKVNIKRVSKRTGSL